MSYCSKCGGAVDSKFCADCGSQVGGSSIKSGTHPVPEDRNILTPNFPAGHMATSYRTNNPQGSFFLWLVISLAIIPLLIPLSLVTTFAFPVVVVGSGIVYGVYTYFLMVDFTKYVEDMKNEGKLAKGVELPFEPTWLFPLLILVPFVIQSLFFILAFVSSDEVFSNIFFYGSPVIYCVPGMIFLYLKHKMMEDILQQILGQNVFRTPISVKNSKLPLTSVGILYTFLFVYLTLSFFIPEIGADAGLEDIGNTIFRIFSNLFILLVLMIFLFGVWTYYEYEWHQSLYELIKNSYASGILEDGNLSKNTIKVAQEAS